MKTITIYCCEVCGYESENIEYVKECESADVPEFGLLVVKDLMSKLPCLATLFTINGKINVMVKKFLVVNYMADFYPNSKGDVAAHKLLIEFSPPVLIGKCADDRYSGLDGIAPVYMLKDNNFDYEYYLKALFESQTK